MFRRQVNKWSAVELWYLLENYHKLSIEELCKDMLKTEDQIEEQAHKFSLGKKPHACWMPRGIFICKQFGCKQIFSLTKDEYKRDKGKFCSIECSIESKQTKKPTKTMLTKDYKSDLSTNDLAKKYAVSKGTIHNWFKFYDIKTYTLSESLKKFLKDEKGYTVITSRLNTMEKKYGNRIAPPKKKGRYHRGLRKDLGISVRSGWEANVLRYIKSKGIKFEYEPRIFIFKGIKKGTLSYLPDVYLTEEDTWLEIKGQLRPGDKVKTRRFKKFYPEEFKKYKVVVLNENSKAAIFYKSMKVPVFAYYNDLKKNKNEIKNWE